MLQSDRRDMWQPRTRRWSRHTDNVAGSSDVSPRMKLCTNRTIATQQATV
jgi:hypothetical protein